MTEGQLRARVAAYTREENWAPRYVADELAATHDELRHRTNDTLIWTARAKAEPDPHQAGQLRAAADQARADVAQLTEQLTALEQTDAARGAWWIETAVTRDHAERARDALALRGITLEDPQERVTAEEWLAAEHHARILDDPYRDITEYDLTPPHAHQLPVQIPNDYADSRPGLELDSIDIRHSRPDPGEHTDTAPARIRPADATVDTVERVTAAVDEIQQRAVAEKNAAAHAAQLEPEEHARRVELARWATDDREPHEHHHHAGTDRDDGELLER